MSPWTFILDHRGEILSATLAHITLVSETEREFGVRFALGELESLKDVGDMVDLIALKLQAR